ncbi:MAG TPA: sugar ABC transporter permease [Treponemataceae bacterium]|jgi:ABC-type sugar transport system permease subunit|nr:sugar ABC transporter permease [Treponemataceae bacterium]HOS29476.1 sugar ABC transporter permease [Treponemataceae bacterium]HQL03697.1 sugar ABC transporter permease [Treponemataceae bacterium]
MKLLNGKLDGYNPFRKRGLAEKKALWGWFFIAPWIVGFIFFFAVPLVTSFYYTLTTIQISHNGLEFNWAGFDNYVYAFTVDPDFTRNIVESALNIVYQVPIIICFSLFIALILRSEFRGKTAMRSIFFLPVIISSGVVITILQQNVFASGTGEASTLFQTGNLTDILVRSGFGPSFTKIITQTIGQIFDLTWRSGVQILLLLSALHSIPDSMYEAAKIEGATGWEMFWKITFILISPTIVMAIIYSIIDYFTDYSNSIMQMIVENVKIGKFEYSTTISILYFAVVMIIILFVNGILSRSANKAVN